MEFRKERGSGVGAMDKEAGNESEGGQDEELGGFTESHDGLN